jgi:hypothetical protein
MKLWRIFNMLNAFCPIVCPAKEYWKVFTVSDALRILISEDAEVEIQLRCIDYDIIL